jgi:hypothetical protein
MSCQNTLENGNPCGDEGELCESCQDEAAKEWSWLFRVPKYAVMPEDAEYYEILKDAGR